MIMGSFIEPPAAKPLIPDDKRDKVYKSMRIRVFMGSFVGYAAYYLVRKNLSLYASGQSGNDEQYTYMFS